MRFALTIYTIAEAGQIAGIDQQMLRDWCRQGLILPQGDDPADDGSFDVFAVAEIIALKALADSGISPEQPAADGIASRCAVSIVWQAVQAAMEVGKQRTETGGRLWRHGLTWLIKKGIRPRCGGLFPPPRFAVWPAGSQEPTVTLDLAELGTTLAERAVRPFVQPH